MYAGAGESISMYVVVAKGGGLYFEVPWSIYFVECIMLIEFLWISLAMSCFAAWFSTSPYQLGKIGSA